jgi:parallel beta-helix repeat protein
LIKYLKQYRFFLCLILISSYSFSETIVIKPSEDSYTEIQEALIFANSGDIIHLSEGLYEFEDSLSIDVDGVTLQGDGMKKTILSFKEQQSGAQGLSVTSDNVRLIDFAVEDAKGDAIKVKGVNGISFIRIRTEWTNGPDESNGAYGLYPVESKNVLIDSCVAIGASDAGIYVGQSENIIVKNSRAEFNVAGIEIENSYYADVFDNHAENNTGGILVFDLPDIPQQGGHHVRVFRNKSINNNTDNFAPEGNIVGEVPRGTGIVIQASSNVEIFDNDIGGNDTINIAIVTYPYETEDENYYPHPRAIQVHNNRFTKSGNNPDLETGELAKILYELSDKNMPDIFWDGILPMKQIIFGQPDNEKLILGDNGSATFLTINPIKYMLPFIDPVERDYEKYKAKITPLSPVVFDESI